MPKYIFFHASFFYYIIYLIWFVIFKKWNESQNCVISQIFFSENSFIYQYLNNSNEKSILLTNVKNLTDKPNKNISVVHYYVDIPKEFKKSTKSLREIHNEGLKCLNKSGSPYGKPHIDFEENFHRRNKHFNDLKQLTAKFRDIPGHCYGSYCGEWIEDVWINTFIEENITTFGPFIPLFIPWLNIFKRYHHKTALYQEVISQIFLLLQPNYLYITVVQSCYGIEGGFQIFSQVPNNLIIISPAGRGHIPIPHLKGIQNISNLGPEKYFASFIGNPNYITRIKTINYFSEKYGKFFFFSYHMPNWTKISMQSIVVLSPRGYANACWRTYEMIQQGYIPVIIYDDIPWIPYRNSPVQIEDFIIFGKVDELNIIDQKIQKLRRSKLRTQLHNKILKFRHLFTYHGVMEQIALFMQGRGFLQCDHYNIRINDHKRPKYHAKVS